MRTPELPIIFACLLMIMAVRADPLDDRLAAARDLLDGGKRPEAAEKFEALKADLKELLIKSPGDGHLLYLAGCVSMDGGDDDGAAIAFDKAINADPKNPEYLGTRALLLEYHEKPAEAAALYLRATEAAPGNARLWADLARTQIQTKQPAAANESLRQAIKLAPENAGYLGMLALQLLDDGKFDEARELLNRAIAANPKFVDGYMNLGQLEQNAGNQAAALSAYGQGLKLQPDDFRAWSKMVQLHEAVQQPEQRDSARDKVFALWKAGKVDQDCYCREQFKHGKSAVMVMEFFELTGERAVRYGFNLIGPDGKTAEKVSLGSYQGTTDVARGTGSIKQDERMFHLDSYQPHRHATLGMFTKEPSYEQTRKMVIDYLEGKLKPMSATTYGP